VVKLITVKRAAAIGILTLGLAPSSGPSAQAVRSFKARLSPVPIDLTMMATVSGVGALTATLTGSTLTVNGTFEGLRSPATGVRLHKSAVTGVSGPAIMDLTATRGTSGTITGTMTLTSAQVADLEKGKLYIQLASEKAPDGNLRGWLLPAEQKR
jgi:hypothetical protein